MPCGAQHRTGYRDTTRQTHASGPARVWQGPLKLACPYLLLWQGQGLSPGAL